MYLSTKQALKPPSENNWIYKWYVLVQGERTRAEVLTFRHLQSTYKLQYNKIHCIDWQYRIYRPAPQNLLLFDCMVGVNNEHRDYVQATFWKSIHAYPACTPRTRKACSLCTLQWPNATTQHNAEPGTSAPLGYLEAQEQNHLQKTA